MIREGNAVRGVRYRDAAGEHELRATLTVAADGRRSDVRRAAGLVPVEHGARWTCSGSGCRASPRDPADPFLRVSDGPPDGADRPRDLLAARLRDPQGRLRGAARPGLDALREPVARLLPFLQGPGRAAAELRRRQRAVGRRSTGCAAGTGPACCSSATPRTPCRRSSASASTWPCRTRWPPPTCWPGRWPPGPSIPESLLARVQRRRTPPTVITQLAQRRGPEPADPSGADRARPRRCGCRAASPDSRCSALWPAVSSVSASLPEHVRSPVESHQA